MVNDPDDKNSSFILLKYYANTVQSPLLVKFSLVELFILVVIVVFQLALQRGFQFLYLGYIHYHYKHIISVLIHVTHGNIPVCVYLHFPDKNK